MKNTLFITLFILAAFSLCGQSWTIRSTVDGHEIDYEYTVITKQQFDRLLNQHTAKGEYGLIDYKDELERTSSTGKVIKGTEPKFNGYYYILTTMTARTAAGEAMLNSSGIRGVLLYGNTNTGNLLIGFTSIFQRGVISLNSNEFTRKYNQMIRWVNGEE